MPARARHCAHAGCRNLSGLTKGENQSKFCSRHYGGSSAAGSRSKSHDDHKDDDRHCAHASCRNLSGMSKGENQSKFCSRHYGGRGGAGSRPKSRHDHKDAASTDRHWSRAARPYVKRVRGAAGPALSDSSTPSLVSLLTKMVRNPAARLDVERNDALGGKCYYTRSTATKLDRDHTLECQVVALAVVQSPEWHRVLGGHGWSSETLEPGALLSAIQEVRPIHNGLDNLHMLHSGVNESKGSVFKKARKEIHDSEGMPFPLARKMDATVALYVDGNEEISADGGTVVSRLLAEFKAVETPYTDCLRHMAEVTRHGPHRKQLEDLADSVVNMYELMAG